MVVGWGWSGDGCGEMVRLRWQWRCVDGDGVVLAAEMEAGVGVWRMSAVMVDVRQWSDDAGEWRRVVASDIWDRIDRVTGNIFGFARNARRKSFPAAATAGGR
nr:hypothetical protein [Tanacetum cinerariifolium]